VHFFEERGRTFAGRKVAYGEHGRRHIEENYSLEWVVDQWENLYVQLLEKS